MEQEISTRRMPARYESIELEDEWAGWTFEARISLPMGQYINLLSRTSFLLGDTPEELSREKIQEMGVGLSSLLDYLRSSTRAWNFVDEEGAPLAIEDDASWALLPSDLVVSMFTAQLGRIHNPPFVSDVQQPPSLSEQESPPGNSSDG